MFIVRWVFYILLLFAILLGAAYLYAPYNDGPIITFPGGELQGPEASAEDWRFASGYETLQLETNPDAPYTVNLNFVLRGDKLYVDPLPGRQWHTYLVENPNVRVRFDKDIYRARAVLVTDEEEKAGMDPTREIYRLELIP